MPESNPKGMSANQTVGQEFLQWFATMDRSNRVKFLSNAKHLHKQLRERGL